MNINPFPFRLNLYGARESERNEVGTPSTLGRNLVSRVNAVALGALFGGVVGSSAFSVDSGLTAGHEGSLIFSPASGLMEESEKKEAQADPELHVAISTNKIEVLRELVLRQDIDLNCKDRNGNTALHTAVRQQKGDMVDLLLQQDKLEINEKNAEGETALHYAARNDNERIFQALIDHAKIDLNAINRQGDAPIHIAIERRQNLKALLKKTDLLINEIDRNGNTALHLAIKSFFHKEALLLICQNGIDLKAKNLQDSTPLHLAVEKRILNVIDALLEKEGDHLNEVNIAGYTPLHLAIKMSSCKIVKRFLKEERTDLRTTTYLGQTALQLAEEEYEYEIAIIIRMELERRKINAEMRELLPEFFSPEISNAKLIAAVESRKKSLMTASQTKPHAILFLFKSIEDRYSKEISEELSDLETEIFSVLNVQKIQDPSEFQLLLKIRGVERDCLLGGATENQLALAYKHGFDTVGLILDEVHFKEQLAKTEMEIPPLSEEFHLCYQELPKLIDKIPYQKTDWKIDEVEVTQEQVKTALNTLSEFIQKEAAVLGTPREGNQATLKAWYADLRLRLNYIYRAIEKNPAEHLYGLLTLAKSAQVCGTGKSEAIKQIYAILYDSSLDEEATLKDHLLKALFVFRKELLQKELISQFGPHAVDVHYQNAARFYIANELGLPNTGYEDPAGPEIFTEGFRAEAVMLIKNPILVRYCKQIVNLAHVQINQLLNPQNSAKKDASRQKVYEALGKDFTSHILLAGESVFIKRTGVIHLLQKFRILKAGLENSMTIGF